MKIKQLVPFQVEISDVLVKMFFPTLESFHSVSSSSAIIHACRHLIPVLSPKIANIYSKYIGNINILVNLV